MLTGLTKWLERPGIQLAVLLVFSLLLRITTFGHPNMDSDEAFYFLIGQQMHEGALPYVDIWDRKPLGLFLIYYLIAGISHSVIAYQIVAWLFVALTAWVIARIVAEISSSSAGLMAGLCYVALLPLVYGWGGQAPIFYNLPVAFAALLLLKAAPRLQLGEPDRRADLAMICCGLAITIKQTALFESIFFGLFSCVVLARSGMSRQRLLGTALKWALLGALPTLLISLFYWFSGHWAEYWHAMVISNFAKQPATPVTLAARAINLYLRILPLLCIALLGLLLKAGGPNAGKHRNFMIGWVIAAWIGFLIVPNLYPHYLLPLFVPLCCVSGLLFSRRDIGWFFFAVLLATSVLRFNFWSYSFTSRAQSSLDSMAQSIRQHDNGRGLFIFDGPILLYAMTGHRQMSPLALPLHLNYAIEENVSHLDTLAETKRILAERPGVVLVARVPRNNPINLRTHALVTRYIQANCRLVDEQWSSEIFRTDRILVFGDCAGRELQAARSR